MTPLEHIARTICKAHIGTEIYWQYYVRQAVRVLDHIRRNTK